MSEVFSIILAVIEVIPKAKAFWDSLVAFYVAAKIDQMKKDDREAIRKAVYGFDQRMLESQIGNVTPGEPSHLPGTVFVDELPNVVQSTQKVGDSSNNLAK